ncbi:hypothetical protein V6N11_013838 [Hibiscus sabdariffa]|uniref:Uncharacterized protein n=1 Tax=Hibiscus sabdariffa TaxID=183260 RepID=A0ABR2N9W8_9ROSI
MIPTRNKRNMPAYVAIGNENAANQIQSRLPHHESPELPKLSLISKASTESIAQPEFSSKSDEQLVSKPLPKLLVYQRRLKPSTNVGSLSTGQESPACSSAGVDYAVPLSSSADAQSSGSFFFSGKAFFSFFF